jgi:hypothetical protein
VQDETLQSYLQRLAQANSLDPHRFTEYLTRPAASTIGPCREPRSVLGISSLQYQTAPPDAVTAMKIGTLAVVDSSQAEFGP